MVFVDIFGSFWFEDFQIFGELFIIRIKLSVSNDLSKLRFIFQI